MRGNFNIKMVIFAIAGCVATGIAIFLLGTALGGIAQPTSISDQFVANGPTTSAEMTHEQYRKWVAKMKAINGDVAETPIQAIERQVFEMVTSKATVDDNGATGTGYGSIDEPTPVKDPSQAPAEVGVNDVGGAIDTNVPPPPAPVPTKNKLTSRPPQQPVAGEFFLPFFIEL